MVGKLSSCQHYDRSCEYVNSIDRGGLYHIQDPVYEMFVAIELIVNEKLSALFSSKGKNIKEMTRDKLSWVCDDEEVQVTWRCISPGTIEEESVRQSLLKEIICLWVTT